MGDDEGTFYPADDAANGAIQEDGVTRTGAGFDPTPYMRQLRGRGGNQEYLDVKWRLLWLRREHPDAEILTDLVRIDENMAIFKATVSLPTGGKATGYGSETAADFGDFIEKAETKAIGRALNALGYGAQFSERGEEEAAPAPPPPARPAPRQESRPAAAAPAPAPAPKPVVEAEPEVEARPASAARTEVEEDVPAETEADERPAPPEPTPIRPVSKAADEAPAAKTRPARAAAPAPVAADAGDEVDMADITWTDFWKWARPLGYSRLDEIERFLGKSISNMTPGEVRVLIREAGASS